jgi:hypothetical protein
MGNWARGGGPMMGQLSAQGSGGSWGSLLAPHSTKQVLQFAATTCSSAAIEVAESFALIKWLIRGSMACASLIA